MGITTRNSFSETETNTIVRSCANDLWPRESNYNYHRCFIVLLYDLEATICQKVADGRRSVITYVSKTLTSMESRYAQIENEALAVVWGCEKFRDYMTGMHFRLDRPQTSHSNISKENLDDLFPWLQRIKLGMMKFSYAIVHISGKELFAAHALSRNPQKVPYKRENLELKLMHFFKWLQVLFQHHLTD